ncbi:hypothetical protein QFC22_000902 [Naganishia vaughanmartiniae]|uniref:Uncharacterized protein n=1 Tax=Naganishia vaughanmartiniae TaxID=1424756 RepID=A0ACC2XLG7_9TREE|nr:hypothetical protein QFC22_000902 [Naganishia vaughanmartiniae]
MATELTTEPSEGSTSASNVQDLQVLILVGLPGSGKSCLANALESTGRWFRASQDDAPNRRRQEAEGMTRNALRTQRNAVVDRVGFDRKQRSHFIEIARESPNVRCTCVILDVKRETLERRLATRTGHPTLVDIDMAMRVLNQMQREYKPPRADQPEGYSRVYVLPESEQPVGGIWSEADLDDLLRKVEASSWRDELYVAPPPPSAPYPRREYAGGISSGQQGQNRTSGNDFERNRNLRGGGQYNSPNHNLYRPRYDDTMQGAPAMNAYGHRPFETRPPPMQYHQGAYDAGSSSHHPARPIYNQINPVDNSSWMNRPIYGNQNVSQNPQHQRGRWGPPRGQLHQSQNRAQYPVIQNGNPNYHPQPQSLDQGALIDAPILHQDGPTNEQRRSENIHK